MDFIKSETFGGIICIIIGFIFIWSMIKLITKENFLNSEKIVGLKKITPLPPVFNYYLIKTLLGLGAIICIFGGGGSIIREILNT